MLGNFWISITKKHWILSYALANAVVVPSDMFNTYDTYYETRHNFSVQRVENSETTTSTQADGKATHLALRCKTKRKFCTNREEF